MFLTPWEVVRGDRAAYFEHELARELGPDHPIYGRRLQAIAITCERDDVLFQLDDGSIAQVHLTYTPHPPETFPGCPRHREYSSLADWMIEVMVPDHVDYFGLWDAD